MASPKIEFIGVTEDHEVPNPRNACKPGILVVSVMHGNLNAILTAPSGNFEDLKVGNPIGFGCTKRRGRFGISTKTWYFNGRSLYELPKSGFAFVADDGTRKELLPGVYGVMPHNFPYGKAMWLAKVSGYLRELRNR